MTAELKHYVNEVGLEIYVDCGRDISAFTNCKLKVLKPSGEEVEWDATIVSYDSETNYLYHKTIEGDLDEAGEYEIQAYGKSGDWVGLGQTAKLIIYEEFA